MLLQCLICQMKLQLIVLHKWNKAVGDRARAFLLCCSWPIAAFKTEFRSDRVEQNSDLIVLLLSEQSSVFTMACVTEASSGC